MHNPRSLCPFLAAAALALASAASLAAEPPRIGVADPKPHPPGTVRLATYNIENLFDNRDDPSLSGNEDDMKSVKPEAARKGVADTLRRIDADIVAMQEVESFDALIEFREQHLRDLGYTYTQSIDVGAERGIEQAVFSRFPIVHAEVWPVMPLEGVEPETIDGKPNPNAGKPLVSRRSPLCVTIEIPAETTGAKPYRLTLIVVHHKSSRGFNFLREAEAEAFIAQYRRLAGENGTGNVAILGDFNATPDQKSVKAYLKAGLIDVVPSHDPDDPAFMTHASNREIDRLFVSPGLSHEVVPNSAFALGTPQLRREEDWRTAPKPPGYASDHIPLVVDITPVDR